MRLPAAAEALLALPPGRFVAERDALAKALAARGDAGAEPVRRLRRPVGMSWMMNRLARERPEGVEALLAAGERLRTGQRRALAGQGSIDLRAAERELREAARALRLAAEPVAAERGRAATPAELARAEARAERVASAASAAEARARAARSRADAANAEVARRREAVAALEREA
jgi:hypothetical protein